MKKTGTVVEICLGVIKPEKNKLEQGQEYGAATKVIDNASKPIDKDMPTIDVNVGTHKCGKKNKGYYRVDNEGNCKKMSFANVTNRLKQRGIDNSEEIDR